MSSAEIIVTGADAPSALATVRSLAKRGVRVAIAATHPLDVSLYSRYASARLLVPPAIADKAGHVQELLRAARRLGARLIIPASQSSLVALDEHREEVEAVAGLASPSSRVIQTCLDKKHALELAGKVGVPAPRSAFVESLEEAQAAAAEIGFPVGIKPRGPWYYSKLPNCRPFKFRVARSPEELMGVLTPLSRAGALPVIQEYCPGFYVGFHIAFVNGRVIGLSQHVTTRRHLGSYGLPATCMTVQVDPVLAGHAVGMLTALDYKGVANVQFQHDTRDGVPKFLEINPRLAICTALSVAAGVDIPWLLYQIYMERPPAGMIRARPGVELRWIRWDVESLVLYLASPGEHLYDPALAKRSRAVLAFILDTLRLVKCDILSIRDPLPGALELLCIIGRLIEILGSKVYGLIRRLTPWRSKKVLG